LSILNTELNVEVNAATVHGSGLIIVYSPHMDLMLKFPTD